VLIWSSRSGRSAGHPAFPLEWRAGLAEGGPLATKRLAYVGTEGSYLMYAARWFPFHDYAVDRATSDITIICPDGLQVAGTSDEPIVPQQQPKDGTSRYRFVRRQPTCREILPLPNT